MLTGAGADVFAAAVVAEVCMAGVFAAAVEAEGALVGAFAAAVVAGGALAGAFAAALDADVVDGGAVDADLAGDCADALDGVIGGVLLSGAPIAFGNVLATSAENVARACCSASDGSK